jgi:hypothetical protein
MMDRKRKKLAVTLAIALLALLNMWRWWPSIPANTSQPSMSLDSNRLEDFEVRALTADAAAPFRRDIFHPKKTVVETKPVVKVVPMVTPEPPPKSPDELAREAAQAAFAQIRCVGISVREKTVHAYLLNGADTFLVSAGDKVGGLFVVEKIMTDRVVLRDPGTGVGGQIDLSGK